MHGVKAVLLDLDHTLYEYHECNDYAIGRTIARLSEIFKKPEEEVSLIYRDSRKKVKECLGNTAASHSRFLYVQKTIEALGGKTDPHLTHEMYDLFWESYLGRMRLNEGVLDFLKALRQKGIKVAVITDLTAHIQFKKVMRLGISEYVDFIVTSEEAGKDKPDEPIFSLALEKLGCTKQEVVVVGDDLEKEIEWAKRLGVRHYHLDPKNFKAVLEHFKSMKEG